MGAEKDRNYKPTVWASSLRVQMAGLILLCRIIPETVGVKTIGRHLFRTSNACQLFPSPGDQGLPTPFLIRFITP